MTADLPPVNSELVPLENSGMQKTQNSELETPNVELAFVPHDRITPEVLRKVDALLESFSAVNIAEAEEQIEKEFSISPGHQRRLKSELRRLFNVASRDPLSLLAAHPQIKQAIEFVLVRDERADKNTLRSAKRLSVVVPATGEQISVGEFLKSLYPREGVNAASCYRALRALCMKKRVLLQIPSPLGEGHLSAVLLAEGEVRTATLEDLPSEASVIRFLRNWRQEFVAVRRGRSRKHDWEAQQEPYVTRDVNEYRPGELWIGDHTELDFMVINERGQLDRRWISAFIDIRTGLVIGYHLSWQPNSQTIALAYRNGVLGSQLRAFTGDPASSGAGKYEHIQITNVPETVMIDNGKDYRSNYTKRVFGKIDFDDAARLSVQRLTRLHYVLRYHGESKAQMERWFKTIQTMLKYLPGFKGNQYQNKPDSLAEDLKAGRILSVAQFDAITAVGINTYNNRVRKSLKDQSPLQCYLTNQTQQRSIDLRVLDFLLMKVQGRRIRRCQVTLLGKEYYSDALMAVNDRAADVYYDPQDLGFVSIYVEGKFAAVASNKEMIGQDERGWLKILHDRKHSEKQMQTELKEYKKGITNIEARMMLLEGELLNMTPVSNELLRGKAATVTFLTGVEQQAKENQRELESEKQAVETQKKAKERSRHQPLTLAMVDRIR
jgi:transposase InsO family protein